MPRCRLVLLSLGALLVAALLLAPLCAWWLLLVSIGR